MNTKTVRAAAAVVEVIQDAVREAGRLSRGLLYLALMEHGCTLAQFEQVEAVLLDGGRVRRQGDLLVWAD